MSTSPADILAQQAGTTLPQVARKWPVPLRDMNPRQIKSRVSYIRRVARHGNLTPQSAGRLAMLLNCHEQIFLKGYEQYLEGAAGDKSGGVVNSPVPRPRQRPGMERI